LLCTPPSELSEQCLPIAGKMRKTVGQRQRGEKTREKKEKFTFINHSRTHFKRSEMNESKKGNKTGAPKKSEKIQLHTFRPQVRLAVSVCVSESWCVSVYV